MGLMTAQEYRESLKDGRIVYIGGEKIEDVNRHPMLKVCIETAALDYEMTHMPEYRDLAVVTLDSGEAISRYYHQPVNGDDLLKRHELMVEATRFGGGAIPFTHDIASDTLNAINITASLMGKPEYAERAEKEKGVTFVGRLATYRYYNMDQVVAMALTEYEKLKSL